MGLNLPANGYKAAHILFVEDAVDLAQTVMRELERDGYWVTHAATGESALQLVQTCEPQLVILDWMLPGINGLDVLGWTCCVLGWASWIVTCAHFLIGMATPLLDPASAETDVRWVTISTQH